jgi:serine protease inhibitor ecotin
VPPDSVRCTRELDVELATFGKMGGRSAIIHRTVLCASGATAISRQWSTATALNAIQCAPESEHAQKGHRTVYRICPVHHRTAQRPHQSELQRSEPNGRLTWLAHRTVSGGAPDCPVRHATDSLPTATFGGWGYKYPNHPTFNDIQVFPTSHTLQELYHSIQDTPKRSNPLPSP